MDMRKIAARNAEVDRFGAGGEEQRAEALLGAVCEPDFADLGIYRDRAGAELQLDPLLAVEIGRAQRYPFLGRVAGKVVLRQIGSIIRSRVIGAQHRHRAGIAVTPQHLGRSVSRRDAAYQLGLVLAFRGQPEAAIPYVEKAIRLSPHDPNLGVFLAVLGACHLLLGHADQATDLLRRARAANHQYWYIHFWLAGALGFSGDLDEARVVLAKAIELKPEVSSQAQYRTQHPWEIDPAYLALRAKTLDVGLRQIGFPDE